MIKIHGETINPEYFPDGTFHLNLPFLEIKNVLIQWYFENNEEMALLYFIKKHYDAQGNICSLDLPYVPNARMDRVKKDTEVFTLKYFCQFINDLNFREVRVCDPHSNVTNALLDRVVTYDMKNIYNALKASLEIQPDIVFFPDEGACKRYSDTIQKFFPNIPVTFGMKERDWETGKIMGLRIMGDDDLKLSGKNVLIIDDICSKGGTFYHSAKALRYAGANNIDLFITHCENTIREGELYKSPELVSHIYTTNSIYTLPEDNRVKIVYSYY